MYTKLCTNTIQYVQIKIFKYIFKFIHFTFFIFVMHFRIWHQDDFGMLCTLTPTSNKEIIWNFQFYNCKSLLNPRAPRNWRKLLWCDIQSILTLWLLKNIKVWEIWRLMTCKKRPRHVECMHKVSKPQNWLKIYGNTISSMSNFPKHLSFISFCTNCAYS